MKRRRARPLLAGTLLTGALIGCGEAVSSPEPPEAVEVPTPLEHPLSFSIALPAEAAPSGPLRIRLFSETGTEPLAEHTTVTEGRNTTVRWKPEVALPERLRIEAVVLNRQMPSPATWTTPPRRSGKTSCRRWPSHQSPVLQGREGPTDRRSVVVANPEEMAAVEPRGIVGHPGEPCWSTQV